MRVLITGGAGFVGPYISAALRKAGIEVVPTKLHGSARGSDEYIALDVTDPNSITTALHQWQPTHVIHLAGIASPAEANIRPEAAWRVHLHGTLNLANAILDHLPKCTLVFASSALVYGAKASAGPLTEQNILAPRNIYAASKAAADLALGALASSGLHSIRLRLFNHTGAGQSSRYAIPSFAKQIARIEARVQPPIIQVKDLDVERDFLDVRDVAAAYVLAVQRADSIEAGTILNIASGVSRPLRSMLNRLIELSAVNVEIRENVNLSSDLSQPLWGDPSVARQKLHWTPKYPIDDTLADVLRFWRQRVASVNQ